MLATSTR